MRPIGQIRTLVYYDKVQIFKGRVSSGDHHVGVLIDNSGVADRYFVAGGAPERLRRFRAGTVDLRTRFLEVEPDGPRAPASARLR